jgi:hypothetical protein
MPRISVPAYDLRSADRLHRRIDRALNEAQFQIATIRATLDRVRGTREQREPDVEPERDDS